MGRMKTVELNSTCHPSTIKGGYLKVIKKNIKRFGAFSLINNLKIQQTYSQQSLVTIHNLTKSISGLKNTFIRRIINGN